MNPQIQNDLLRIGGCLENAPLNPNGPWTVTTRHMRGGLANSKCWAILFTCMSIIAVHFEVIQAMDTSSYINALHCFFTIRGPAK